MITNYSQQSNAVPDAVWQFLDEHGIDKTDGVLLAVSGGVDSAVLLDAVKRLGGKTAVAHCNFGLRGADSENDEAFVKAAAEKYGIPFYAARFHAAEIAKRENKSVQHAARDLRYDWLEATRRQLGFAYVATAHHANDNVETVLQHVLQGTGLAGLRGIPPVNNRVIRPLLRVSKADILIYANANKIDFRTDSSNFKTDYLRNKIRLEVMPLLESINPSLVNTLNQNAERWHQAHAIYHQAVEKIKRRLVRAEAGAATVNIASLLSVTSPPTVLYELLKDQGFNAAQSEEIFDALSGESGKVFYSDTHRVLKDRNQIVIALKTEPTFYHVVEQGNVALQLPNAKLFIETIPNSPNINFDNASYQYIDAGKLLFPLTVRPWKKGDYFYPFGLNKKKKLSDFFTNQKLSVRDKEQQPLLQSGDHLVAIPGMTVDHRFRVTPSTKLVMKIRLVNSD